jgi:uncharacterized membrane protein YbhN (UPF0104 family)/membrane-associated phospholipid phosphatase
MKTGAERLGDEPSTGKPGPPANGSGGVAMPLGRHPRDLVVLLVALGVFVLCALVASRSALNPVETAIFDQLGGIPAVSAPVWQVLDWLGGWVGIALVGALALYLKRIRLALQCAAAGVLAWGLAGLAGGIIGPRAVPPALLAPGVRLPGDTGFAFPSVPAAVAAAMAAVAAPYLRTGYRRTAWVVAVLVAAADVYLGHSLPVDAFGGVFLGWAIGVGFHLAFGAPGRRTSAAAVQQALQTAGLAPVLVEPVRSHRLGPLEFAVTTAEGRRLRVEVVRRLHRRAGPWYRIRRLLASLDVEDEPPLSSTYHEAEHEALVTLLAERGGVPTPPVLLACQAPDGSALLVRYHIDGRRLTELRQDEITDYLLETLWDHIGRLGEAGIAHHDLRAKNILIDTHGEPWLLNLTLGRAGVTTERTAQDVAEALVSVASLAGIERTVVTASAKLPPDKLEAALSYLQPLALPRRIRKQLASGRYGLIDLRETLSEQIGRPIPTFRSPLRPTTVIGLLLAGAAIYALLPQLANLSSIRESLTRADPVWLGVTVLTGLVAILFAGISVVGSSTIPLPFWRTTAVQVAAAFTGRTTPGGVGFFGINVAFMERLSIRRSQAVGVSVLNVAATGVVGGIWSVAGAFGLGTAGMLTGISIPHGLPALATAGGLLIVAGAVLASPFGRRKAVRPAIAILTDLAGTLRQPVRAAQLFGGAAAYLAVSGLGLVTSLAAFAPQVPVFAVLTVFVIGQTFGHIIPSPGGLGAVESLMVGGLVALGIPPTTSVAAVLTSRLLTYWLPVLPGIATFRYLQHRSII